MNHNSKRYRIVVFLEDKNILPIREFMSGSLNSVRKSAE